jgi:hypothetical protein
MSWGSQFTVDFHSTSPTETRLTVTTKEKFAISDWGRGKRATHRLLHNLGAGVD